ncbi:hypothetical protein L6164_007051 [Bauhinia variegata]|uniref:Uncharacterized protein n=1 Tax=Bauhinia variegata TaxID=167791 RepID=A0ACB9PW64_BAUVA|nr:hypothetical protein L6164_007051 [Bauhinia variegata]
MAHCIDVESSKPQFLGPNKLVSISVDLYNAIREGDKEHFDSKFKELNEQKELGLSEVIDHVRCAGDTLLHMAAKYGKQDIVQLIAKEFPQLITRANCKGDTPLHVAARSAEKSGLVKVILEAYIKHSPKKELCRTANDFGNTPLHEAVIWNNFEGAEVLYQENELVAHNYLNKGDKSPILYVAVESGNVELVYLLLHAPMENHDKIQKGKSPLLAAIL